MQVPSLGERQQPPAKDPAEALTTGSAATAHFLEPITFVREPILTDGDRFCGQNLETIVAAFDRWLDSQSNMSQADKLRARQKRPPGRWGINWRIGLFFSRLLDCYWCRNGNEKQEKTTERDMRLTTHIASPRAFFSHFQLPSLTAYRPPLRKGVFPYADIQHPFFRAARETFDGLVIILWSETQQRSVVRCREEDAQDRPAAEVPGGLEALAKQKPKAASKRNAVSVSGLSSLQQSAIQGSQHSEGADLLRYNGGQMDEDMDDKGVPKAAAAKQQGAQRRNRGRGGANRGRGRSGAGAAPSRGAAAASRGAAAAAEAAQAEGDVNVDIEAEEG
ncbi:unnamed protein product [Vitrella brassicaformis CCMP3155]|uniref:Uncharacterized protein n=1 Tax=Vitrella brassicaformis (strain CCMP3155) TaxID=1169540 RepID=A0A0G4F4G9_VITBC|nr:unnamed protein product [Vitrella brassicaformis CCMP3155]|eukprot:CEM06773.1 unnamed protein product [Vitrella brassicaformis CCMP3155]